jgi:flagellar hook-associated protein 3 FlgL
MKHYSIKLGRKKMGLNITSLTSTQLVLNLASKNQSAVEDLSIQIASGNKHRDFKGFAEDATTESFIYYNSTLTNITANVSSNNFALAIAKTTDSAISQIQGYASELSSLIAQRNNSASGENVLLTTQAKGLLDNISNALNINFDGRFVFAGSKTDTRPVQDIQTSNIEIIGLDTVATASYYHGDSHINAERGSDSENVEYGVLANDPAFRNLIGAAHLAIEADASGNKETLGNALDMVNLAIDQLASTRAIGRIAIDKMTKNNVSLTQTQLIVQENLDKISQTDIVAATAQMSSLQAIVQAGYLAYSRLSSLQLSTYLR